MKRLKNIEDAVLKLSDDDLNSLRGSASRTLIKRNLSGPKATEPLERYRKTGTFHDFDGMGTV